MVAVSRMSLLFSALTDQFSQVGQLAISKHLLISAITYVLVCPAALLTLNIA